MLDLLMILGSAVMFFSSVPMLLGFGTAGITGGSIAASIQSSLGLVKSGSLFAKLTSLAMKNTFFNGLIAGSLTTLASIISQIYPGYNEPSGILSALGIDSSLLLDVTSTAITTIGFMNGLELFTGYLKSSSLYSIVTLGIPLLDAIASSILDSLKLAIGFQSVSVFFGSSIFKKLILLALKNPWVSSIATKAIITAVRVTASLKSSAVYAKVSGIAGKILESTFLIDAAVGAMNSVTQLSTKIYSSYWFSYVVNAIGSLADKAYLKGIGISALNKISAFSSGIKSSAAYSTVSSIITNLPSFDMEKIFSKEIIESSLRYISVVTASIQLLIDNTKLNWVFYYSKFSEILFNAKNNLLATISNYSNTVDKAFDSKKEAVSLQEFVKVGTKEKNFVDEIRPGFWDAIHNEMLKSYSKGKSFVQGAADKTKEAFEKIAEGAKAGYEYIKENEKLKHTINSFSGTVNVAGKVVIGIIGNLWHNYF